MNTQTNGKIEYLKLDWDSKQFNVKAAKVNILKELSLKDIEEIKVYLNEYDFVTIVNKGNNYSNNQLISSINNVFLSDINIQFEKFITKEKIELNNQNIKIENKSDYDSDIVKISENSFLYSRFFNDKKLIERGSKYIYKNWVENSFNKESKYFIKYYLEKRTVGFILFSLDISNKNAIIDLIAIDDQFQNKGIGNILIDTLERYTLRKGILKIKVGTQVDNLNGISFYQKNFFKPVEVSSIYHFWKD